MMAVRKAISDLIFLGLLLTPVLGLQSWLRVLPSLGIYLADGPHLILLKGAKDLLLCAILILFILDVLRGRRVLCDPLLLLTLTLVAVSALATVSGYRPFLGLIGLRGLSPLLLVLIAYSYLDMFHVRTVVRILSFLLFVELCSAWIRAKYGLAIHGTIYFGLAGRPSGTFASPSGWSIFLSFIICYLLGFDLYAFGRPRAKTWFFVTVAVLLIYLSGSGASILALAAIVGSYCIFFGKSHRYVRAAAILLLCSVLVLALLHLDVLTGRPFIYRSIGTRTRIFSDIVASAGPREILLGRGLGIGSNAAVTAGKLGGFSPYDIQGTFIADSLYASLIAQAGIPFLAVFMLFSLWVFRKALAARYAGANPIAILAIPAFFAGGLGNVTIEVFPVNWLLCIAYGLVLKRPESVTSDCSTVAVERNALYSLACTADL